jgi:Tfp pilus assembly protein PilX
MNVPESSQRKHSGRAGRLIERARRRRGERGAAVFLVVLVLTIVAAIGVFSMRSAGLVDLATGYSRQSVQSTFMANFAARAAATYLETNPGLATSTEYVTGCASALRAIDATAPCMVFKTNVLGDALRVAPDGMAGQLSLPSSSTQLAAEFVTEMTEPSIANIRLSPGFTSGLFKQVTFTSIARVYPTAGTITGVCSTAARGTVSQQTLRAHVIVP